MTSLLSLAECWQLAEQRTENLPPGVRILSKLGLTATKYIISGNNEIYRPLVEQMYALERQDRVVAEFRDEVSAFTTPFGNLENAMDADVLMSEAPKDIDLG